MSVGRRIPLRVLLLITAAVLVAHGLLLGVALGPVHVVAPQPPRPFVTRSVTPQPPLAAPPQPLPAAERGENTGV